MAAANSNIQLAGLDFNAIKTNFTNYLKSQSTFSDYNFEGSGLSTLLDVLAYNTQYNSFYLNMVANEMFLDTALQRSSVVSHAKLLGYTPKSSVAPTAYANVVVHNVFTSSLTLPQYTNFLSESVDGVNYNFVTVQSATVNTNLTANTVTFNPVELKQGLPVTYTFTVDSVTNPTYTFELPDNNIDTSTISVIVKQSAGNSSFQVYNLAGDYTALDNNSQVYFLQEALNGNYQIYFGNGILGNQLSDGNVVIVSYIITQGGAAAGANNFVLMDSIPGFGTVTVKGITPATAGGNKESLASIKFQAPKSFSAQGRAVTKDDYITAIQQNNMGFSFDAVNVWGGQENDPPVYGQVFVSVKPSGSYLLTESQKSKLVETVIKPISVLTVEPTIIDPDYTYTQITCNLKFDSKKTTLSATQMQTWVTSVIQNFCTRTLNNFNSTFMASDLTAAIKASDPSIIASEITLKIQKKFFPNLTSPTTYKFDYGVPLQKGILLSGVSSSPDISIRDTSNSSTIIQNVYIEEVPSLTGGVETINVTNPGFGYLTAPTVTILGDGTGATAVAVLNGQGSIKEITVTNAGTNYTSAIVQITNQPSDTSGKLGAAVASLQGRYGTLRTYYNNTLNAKTVLQSNIGTIDYLKGIITLNSFNPYNVGNQLGQLSISVTPVSTIVSSSYNKIITLDIFDPNSVSVNVTTI